MTRPKVIVYAASSADRLYPQRRRSAPVRPRKPADTPFPHGDRCRTPDADPEWVHEGAGVWTRTCSCETQRLESVEREPVKLPDPARHVHGTDEDGRPCTATARASVDADGVESTYCATCGTRRTVWDMSGYESEDLDRFRHNYAVR